MNLSLIAAVGRNNELGKDNDLIWHFKEDMRFFKNMTMGAAVIMGRKTFESLPKALPGRRNIVITSNPDYIAQGAETASSVEEALEKVKNEKAFVIGGGSLYAELLPACDELYLTEIDSECPDADIYFPLFNKDEYTQELLAQYTVDGICFCHKLYKKRG